MPPAQVDLPAVLEIFHELVVEQVHRRLVDVCVADLVAELLVGEQPVPQLDRLCPRSVGLAPTFRAGGGLGDEAVILAVPPWVATALVPGLAAPDDFRAIVNGPEGFTPDNEFCLGETDVGGFFVAAGMHALQGRPRLLRLYESNQRRSLGQAITLINRFAEALLELGDAVLEESAVRQHLRLRRRPRPDLRGARAQIALELGPGRVVAGDGGDDSFSLAELLPELITLDEWGYPIVLGPVRREEERIAKEIRFDPDVWIVETEERAELADVLLARLERQKETRGISGEVEEAAEETAG